MTSSLFKGMHEALKGKFVVPADLVSKLQRDNCLSTPQLLTALIPTAAALARPPISGFHVGAVGLGTSGSVYFGVNLEFPGAQLSNSVHAEQSLLANAAWHGETAVERLAVSAAPCGHCRQFMSELACADDMVISFGDPPTNYSLLQLLPQRFGPLDLLDSSKIPLLLQPQDHGASFAAGSAAAALQRATLSDSAVAETQAQAHDAIDDAHPTKVLPESVGHEGRHPGVGVTSSLEKAADAALHAANQAYSPYTYSPSGVALVMDDEGVHWGAYLESAAFNPSLPPLQSALTAVVRAGVPSYEQITHAILVEVPTAPVRQAEATRLLLSSISPNARLIVLDAAVAS